MTIVVGGLQVFIRDDVERFTANFRGAATNVGQQSERMRRAVGGVSDSVERMNRAAASSSPNAFRALAVSALRAEDNVKRLESALLAVSALAGGFAGAFVVRGLVQAADEYRNIQNRLSTIAKSESERVAYGQAVYEIAQRTRTEYASTATLFARISTATDKLGASAGDVLRVVETVQKSFSVAGSTTQEAQSAAIQLSQGLASGKLQGDELRSILENNIPLARLLARELAGGDIGALRELGTKGQLDPKAVFQAILRGSGEVDAAFARTASTTQQALLRVSNAITEYVGTLDQSFGATRLLVEALSGLAANFAPLANAALIAAGALATVFLSNKIVSGAGALRNRVTASTSAQVAALKELEDQARATQGAMLRSVFANEPVQAAGKNARELAAQQEGRALRAIAREETSLQRLQEERAQLAGKLAAQTADTSRIEESASKRRQAAETRLADLITRRQQIEAQAAAGQQNVDRSKLGGFYRAAFDLDSARASFEAARADEVAARARAERVRETLRLVSAERQTSGPAGVVTSTNATAAIQATAEAQKAAETRRAAGEQLLRAQQAFAAQESAIQSRQLSQAEKYATQITSIEQRVAGERAKIQNIDVAEQTAVAKKLDAVAAQRVAIQGRIAEVDKLTNEAAARISAGRSQATEAIASRMLANANAMAVAQSLVAEKSALATKAADDFARANTLSARAIETARAAGNSLIGFLGGPWGAALTAGTIAISIFGARTLKEAERLKRAQETLEQAATRAAGGGGAAAAPARDNLISRQIQSVQTSLTDGVDAARALQREIDVIGTSLAKAGPSIGFRAARAELDRLLQGFQQGTIDASTFEKGVGAVNSRYGGAKQLADEFIRLSAALKANSIGAQNLDRDLAKLVAERGGGNSFRQSELESLRKLQQLQAETEAKGAQSVQQGLGGAGDPQYPFVAPDQLRNSLDLLTSFSADYQAVIDEIQGAAGDIGGSINRAFASGLPALQTYSQATDGVGEAVNNLAEDERRRQQAFAAGLPQLQSYQQVTDDTKVAVINLQTEQTELARRFEESLPAIGTFTQALGNSIEAISGMMATLRATGALIDPLQKMLEKSPLGQLPDGPPAEITQATLAAKATEIVNRAAGDREQKIRDRTQAIYEENRAMGASIEWARRTAEAEVAAAEGKKAGAKASREAATEQARLAKAYRDSLDNIREKTAEYRLEVEAVNQSKQSQYEAKILLDEYIKLSEKGVVITREKALALQQEASAAAQAAVARDQMQKAISAADDVRSTLGSTTGGFLNDIANGTTLVEGLRNAFVSLRTAILNALGNQIIASMFGAQGTPFNFFGTPVPGFAAGGDVRGPGTSRSDSIPAMLSDGEFVVNAQAARRHSRLLEAINSGRPARMATGGWADRGARSLASRHSSPMLRTIDQSARDNGGRKPVPVNVTISGAAGNSEVKALVASGVAQGLREYESGEDARQGRRQLQGASY